MVRHTPSRRGGLAEALRHQLVALSLGLGRLVEKFGDKADLAKYRAFVRGAEEIAERLARTEANPPLRNPERLALGVSITDPNDRNFK